MRLNRAEKKAATRSRLLEAASEVFARRGLHGASVEEIAEEAGFSKGAVYSNFRSKEDFFFALLEERVARRVREVTAVVDPKCGLEDSAHAAADQFMAIVRDEREWFMLFIEAWVRAARDPELAARFEARFAAFREVVASLIESRLRALGIDRPAPAEQLATAVIGLGNGIGLERLIAPDHVPEDLFGRALSYLLHGMAQAGEKPEATATTSTGSPGEAQGR